MTVVFWELVECRFSGPSQETLIHLRRGLGKVVLFLRNVDIASHLIILSPHLVQLSSLLHLSISQQNELI